MPATVPGRWGQLTYTSFDRMDGRGGGWQVKDSTGHLTEQEIDQLRGRVQTQLDTGSELPRFPTPTEIAELPRKLLYAPAGTEPEQCASWHIAPAGNDASGRPGNVFAHVLLDRNPDQGDLLRPIQRWRSAGWLTPFGPEAVLAAELVGEIPPGEGVLNPTTIASWLFAPRTWRLQNLAALLDATRAALSGGPAVLLGVDDLDEGANWIAAVSFAMSPGTARRLFFSTSERPGSLGETLGRGVHLCCVPATDLPALRRREDVVMLDTTDLVELGDLGGAPHRSTRGDAIPVTEWSVLIAELFDSAENLPVAVSRLDELAQQIGDHGLDPAWPAAMLLARDSGGSAEASQVLIGCAPQQLRGVPQMYQSALTTHRAAVGADTAAAWQQVVQAGADDPMLAASVSGEMAVRVYAERALVDLPWLATEGLALLPSKQYYSPSADPELVTLAASAVPHWRAAGPLVLLHATELVLRLGLAHDQGLMEALWQASGACLIPSLLDRTAAAELLGRTGGRIADETRGWLWTQLLQTPIEQLGPLGHRLDPQVLVMLGPGPEDPDPLPGFLHWLDNGGAQGPDGPAQVPGVLAELAAGRSDETARLVGIWAALRAHRDGDPAALQGLEKRLWPLLPDSGMSLLERGFGELPSQFHLPELLARAADPATDRQWRRLAQRRDRGPIPVLARARLRLDAEDRLTAAEPAAVAEGLFVLAEMLEQARAGCPDLQPDKDLVRRAQLWSALALLAGRAGVPGAEQAEVAAGRAQTAWHGAGVDGQPTLSQEELAEVAEWSARHGISTRALTTLLLLGDPASPLYRAGDRAAGWLQGVQAAGQPLVGALLRAVLTRDAESRDRASEQMLQAARQVPGSTDERELRQAERFLTGWLRQAVRRR